MTELFSMDSSLCQYTSYADICGSSFERTHHTTVGAIHVDICCHVGLLKISH